jgi:glucan phosphoethanolaminetransferase (alkaline phosphatase superfamily)
MKKSKFDLRWFLILASVAVEIPRFAGMFLAADVAELDDWLSSALHWGSVFSGLAMGVLYAIGAMYLSHGLMKSFQNRNLSEIKKMLNLKFIALIVITGFIIYMAVALLTPYTVSRMTGQTLAATLDADAHAWAMLASIAPLLLMIGAFMSGSVSFDGGNGAENTGKLPRKNSENSGKIPETAKPNWSRVDPADYDWLSKASTGEIQGRYGLEERTARNWRTKAQEARPKVSR